MSVSFVVSAFHGKAAAVDSTMLFSKTMLLLAAKLTRTPPGDLDRTPFALMVSPENAMWLEEFTARDENTGVCAEPALIVRNCEYFRLDIVIAP